MKLKHLTIQSFRGIKELDLEFIPDQPTVILGVNGVGKSSILECIAILLSRFASPIHTPNASGRLFREDDIYDQSPQTSNEITVTTANGDVKWSLTKQRTRRSKQTSSNLLELRQLVAQTQAELHSNSQFNLPILVYYAVNRAVIDIPLKMRTKPHFAPVAAYDQALDKVQINFNNFFQWFRALEDIENETCRDRPDYRHPQLEAVRQAITSVLSDFSHLRIRRSPLRMTVNKNGRELIINQLSDGEKCLLAMVGDLARRLAIANPSLENPLTGTGIVLIDEIELHLHPKWQREIIPAIARTFPNCQLIATTHSPQVVSHIKPESVYILEPSDTGIIATTPTSSFGRDTNSILEDLMEVPERPQQIKDKLQELFICIDNGNIETAKQIRHQLAEQIGEDEPEFVRADILIRRQQILR